MIYAKVFSSLWCGSLRGQPDEQLVFIYLLAHADEDGVVDLIVDKIIDDTGLDGDDVTEALRVLGAPDPLSRQTAEEGRRLLPLYEHGAWGWRIVNYEYYRNIRNLEERRRQNREAQARFKEKHRSSAVSTNQPGSAQSAKVEVEVEVEVEELESTHLAENPAVGVAKLVEGILRPKEEWDEAFREDFWKLYPRKIKKPHASKAWQALRPTSVEDQPSRADEICSGVERWLAYWREVNTPEDKIPYPASFLNGRQFEDFPS